MDGILKLRRLFSKIKGIIFDIDGTLTFQGKVYPGAIDTIDAFRNEGLLLRFLTNSTLHSRQSCTDKLSKSGFHVFSEEVITASYATARYLDQIEPRSCWILLEGEGLREFACINQDSHNPEYIVVGDNRSKFDFNHLNKALRCLLNGSKLIGMNPDLVDSSFGAPELNVGSWVKMLELASGVDATYIGKPSPLIYEHTLAGMELDKEQVLMVGDRVQTDIIGAKEYEIRSGLVKTGEFKLNDLTNLRPDFILDSVADLVKLMIK